MPLGEYVAVGFELFHFGKCACCEPRERIPPQQGFQALHNDPFERMAVDDVTLFVGEDRRNVFFCDGAADINRAEEGERCDLSSRAYQYDTSDSFLCTVSSQASDQKRLPEHGRE